MANLSAFKRVTDDLDMGLIILDEYSNVVYLNSWVEEVGEVSLGDVYGKSFLHVFEGIADTRVWESATDALIFGLSSFISAKFIETPFDFYQDGFNGIEYYRIKQNISVKPLLLSEDVFGCEILVHDVTDVVKREEALTHASIKLNATAKALSNERDTLSAILDSSKSAILSFNENGHIKVVNRAVEKVFGYKADEIKKLSFFSLFSKKDEYSGPITDIDALLLSAPLGKAGCPVLRAYRKDGSPIWIELQMGVVSEGARGERMVIVRDVTALLELEKTLKNSENRFKALTNIAPVGIFYTDMHGLLKYVNGMWTLITECTLSDMLGKRWHEVVFSKDTEVVLEKWQQSQASGSPFASEFRIKAGYKIVWVLCQVMEERDTYNNIVGYVGTVTDVTAQRESHNQIEMLAFYDPLTTLANRRLFRDRLEHAVMGVKRNGNKVALLNLDLDDFKKINDSLGHDAGDLLLTNVASRLKECVRKEDTVARLGGDEFAILLVNIESSSIAGLIAEKVIAAVRKPITLPEQKIQITVSVGIAICPDDAIDANGLVKNSDIAMYSAKSSGRNRFGFFTQEMNECVMSRFAMERDLEDAIKQSQFFLLYQPQYCVTTQKFIGMEALIRWQSPDRGLVPPDVFIQVAEQSGQIVEIGDWVLDQACEDMKRLLDKNMIDPESRICVNLSPKQFLEPRLPYVVHKALVDSGLPAKNLELEITESMLMENLDVALSLLRCLKGFGVFIAIDDFGTGYSSLGYLKQLPVDTLKIDRCFINDLVHDDQDKGIVSAIIVLAHKLKLSVIAEGIEVEEQLLFLKQNDCDYAQGYFLSKPLPFDNVVGNIERNIKNNDEPKSNRG